MAPDNNLKPPQRLITTHNEQGKSILEPTLDTGSSFYSLAPGAASFSTAYATSSFPPTLSADADLQVYKDFLTSPPGMVNSTGTILRYVDIPPAFTSPMHRTVSLDYGVLLEGEVDLILDSGETKAMKRGDLCVQRATMHAWKNTSEMEWARMLFILQPVQPFSVAGEEIKEDYGGATGVKVSE
jgi:hypothetical protein